MKMHSTLLIGLIAAVAAWADVEEKDTIRRSFTLGGTAPEVVIDNIEGNVVVRGRSGNQVEVEVQRTIRGRSAERIAEAKQDVKLETQERPGIVRIYVNTPDRNSDGSYRGRDESFYGYRVIHDMQITVPANCRLYAKTVNGKLMQVIGTNGEFEVRNVNGEVKMEDISGWGKVGTVNGSVDVSFTQNPTKETSFSTINGTVRVAFPRNLSADVRMKTMHGDLFTDFPVTARAAAPPTTENRGSKWVFRGNQYSNLRIGNGGPELTFNTLNGNIEIRQK